MASGVYNKFKYGTWTKAIDLVNDAIKVALLDSNHSFAASGNTWADVSANEVSGTGYTAGGATLAGKSVTEDDTNNWAKWDATDPAWTSSSITARHAVFYDTTVSDNLICSFDFGANKTSTGGTWTLTIGANGILTNN